LILKKNGKVCFKEIIENLYRQYLPESALKMEFTGLSGNE